tara:strand:- start:294 stop:965 length:672 start_codon:yes stop_codon:yes gene_type:complete
MNTNDLYLPVETTPEIFGPVARETLLHSCKPLGHSQPGDIVGIFLDITISSDGPVTYDAPAQVLVHNKHSITPQFDRMYFEHLSGSAESAAALTMMRLASGNALNRNKLHAKLREIHALRREETPYEILITPDFAVVTYLLYGDHLYNFDEDQVDQGVIDECMRVLLPPQGSSHDVIELATHLQDICSFVNTLYPVEVSPEQTMKLKAPAFGPLMQHGYSNAA